jgi:hypothetical protein
MRAQGGPAAAMAEQMLARMGGATPGRGATPGGGGTLIEITADSSGFSSEAVPESVFSIPGDYTRTDQK